jgi:hypothetical protein
MTVSDTPQPPERPEDEGIPDHAADTSTAYDEADRPRFDDSPAALPADTPQAVDEFGVTGPEGRAGEPLADKLRREQPDTAPDTPVTGEVLGEPEADPGIPSGQEYDPLPGAPDAASDGVGRLVEPDQGARTDDEPDAIADDAGEAGGGPSAEEAAMHELPADQVPYRR